MNQGDNIRNRGVNGQTNIAVAVGPAHWRLVSCGMWVLVLELVRYEDAFLEERHRQMVTVVRHLSGHWSIGAVSGGDVYTKQAAALGGWLNSAWAADPHTLVDRLREVSALHPEFEILREALRAIVALEERVAQACERPPDDCLCPGCSCAAEINRRTP